MLSLFRKKSVTLVELLVVMVIMAILATASIAVMHGGLTNAITHEAVMGLGAVNIAMKQYRGDHGTYAIPGFGGGGWVSDASGSALGDYIRPQDLDGAFFNRYNYFIASCTTDTFYIKCTFNMYYADGGTNPSPRRAQAEKAVDDEGGEGWISIDQTGTLRQRNVSASGFPPA